MYTFFCCMKKILHDKSCMLWKSIIGIINFFLQMDIKKKKTNVAFVSFHSEKKLITLNYISLFHHATFAWHIFFVQPITIIVA